MHLQVTITKDQAIDALSAWFPFKMALSDDNPERRLVLTELYGVEPIPDVGIKMSCKGMLHWPLPILPDSFELEAITVVVGLKIIEIRGGVALGLTLNFEEFEIDNIPGFVEQGAAMLISNAVNDRSPDFAWSLTETIRFHRPISEQIQTMRSMGFAIPTAELSITSEALTLSGRGVLSFVHDVAATYAPPTSP